MFCEIDFVQNELILYFVKKQSKIFERHKSVMPHIVNYLRIFFLIIKSTYTFRKSQINNFENYCEELDPCKTVHVQLENKELKLNT